MNRLQIPTMEHSVFVFLCFSEDIGQKKRSQQHRIPHFSFAVRIQSRIDDVSQRITYCGEGPSHVGGDVVPVIGRSSFARAGGGGPGKKLVPRHPWVQASTIHGDALLDLKYGFARKHDGELDRFRSRQTRVNEDP
jgi:hypothetical protein